MFLLHNGISSEQKLAEDPMKAGRHAIRLWHLLNVARRRGGHLVRFSRKTTITV